MAFCFSTELWPIYIYIFIFCKHTELAIQRLVQLSCLRDAMQFFAPLKQQLELCKLSLNLHASKSNANNNNNNSWLSYELQSSAKTTAKVAMAKLAAISLRALFLLQLASVWNWYNNSEHTCQWEGRLKRPQVLCNATRFIAISVRCCSCCSALYLSV